MRIHELVLKIDIPDVPSQLQSKRVVTSLILTAKRLLHLLSFCFLLFRWTTLLVAKANGHLVAKSL